MKHLKQFEGEISREQFEDLLGDGIEVVGDEGATVTALEVTPDPSITSCTIYLDQAPPEWLVVGRQWPDGTDYHRDWKREVINAWNGTEYVVSERYFTHVEIVGGKYDVGGGGHGPFDLWLATTLHNEASRRVKNIGWALGTTYQHTNIYFSLSGEEPPDPEPPDPEPPDPEPPDPGLPCNCAEIKDEIDYARGHIQCAIEHLDTAEQLCDGCCSKI